MVVSLTVGWAGIMKTRKQILLCSEGRVIKNVLLTTRSEKTTVEDHQKFIAQSFYKDVTRYPFFGKIRQELVILLK